MSRFEGTFDMGAGCSMFRSALNPSTATYCCVFVRREGLSFSVSTGEVADMPFGIVAEQAVSM